MRSALRLGATLCALFLFAATSHSNTPPPSLPPETAAPESTTSAPIPSDVASTSAPPRDPFTPYDIGPGAAWRYEDLSPAERVVADRGRDTKGWDHIHNVFAAAVAERAHLAVAEAAEHQLGVDNLAGTGVVP